MSIRLLLTALLVGQTCAVAGQPPWPDPKNPVDYVAWVNEEYGGSITVNAAKQYDAAFDALVLPSNQLNEELRETVGALYRSDEEGPDTVPEWIEANRNCLKLVLQASRVSDCFYQRTSASGSLMDVLYPHTAYFRSVRILLATRARHRLMNGDSKGALDDTCTLLRIARHLHTLPSSIEHLAGNATAASACRMLRDLPKLVSHPVDYEALFSQLRSADRPTRSPAELLPIEKIAFLDGIQRLPSSPGSGPLVETGADVEVAVAEVERVYRYYHRFYEEGYAVASELHRSLEQKAKSTRKNMDPTREGEVLRVTVRLLLSITEASLWNSSVSHRKLLAERNAAYVVLAMHAYKERHGRWPQSLMEATGDDLAEFRSDPFSGQDLVYRIVGGQPQLYSAGLNGKDDGGKCGDKVWADDADALFWPPADKKK